MAREILAATFKTWDKAHDWSRFLTHKSIDPRRTNIVVSRERPGRFQVAVWRRSKEEAELI